MRWTWVVATVVVGGLAVAGWAWRGSAALADVARAVGVQSAGTSPQTGTSLKAAGVHKCVGPAGTLYVDGPCPNGSREVAATGGTLTVTAFPKPAPAPSALASSVLGAPIVKPMDPEERDRLRDKAIEDAANRH